MTASRFAVIKEQVFATAKMFQDCEPVIRRRLLNDALYKQAKQLSDDLFELILEITEEEVNNV